MQTRSIPETERNGTVVALSTNPETERHVNGNVFLTATVYACNSALPQGTFLLTAQVLMSVSTKTLPVLCPTELQGTSLITLTLQAHLALPIHPM